MDEAEENRIRKRIWERKDAVDAKVSEPGYAALPAEEQDAWVLGLYLDIPLDQAAACISGTADAAALEAVREKAAETFRYGKRKALRALKEVLSRHEALQTGREAEA